MLTSEEREQLALISGPRARQTVSELVPGAERVVGSPAELEEAHRVRDLLQPFVDSSVGAVPCHDLHAWSGTP